MSDTVKHATDDATANLAGALEALDAKLPDAEGLDNLSNWIVKIESLLSNIEASDLDRTCGEIKTVIEKLLSVRAEVEKLNRLKKILA